MGLLFHLPETKLEKLRTKKLLIELTQKDTLLSQEIEKTQKVVRVKDLVIDKTKEAFLQKMDAAQPEILVDWFGNIYPSLKKLFLQNIKFRNDFIPNMKSLFDGYIGSDITEGSLNNFTDYYLNFAMKFGEEDRLYFDRNNKLR